VGKTYITALLVKKLRSIGLNAGYYKAALSGAEWVDGVLIAGDALYVCAEAGLPEAPDSLVSYIYELAASPHLAAQQENRPVEMERLQADFARSQERFDFITVEGSGGIVCPLRLDQQEIMLTDVIRAFNLNVVIVAPAGLGTINGVVLTAEYARGQGIPVAGVIFNHYDQDDLLHADNKNQVERLTGLPVLACVAENAVDFPLTGAALARLYEEI
jgi:dethiobiotin synthetase